MDISVQSGGLEEIFGIDGAYRLMKEAGFDGVDANLDHIWNPSDIKSRTIPEHLKPGTTVQDVIEFVKPWGEAAKKYGLKHAQAHAPFPGELYDEVDEEYEAFIMDVLQKTIIAAGTIEIPKLVVHPFLKGYKMAYDRETEWEHNIERYMKLVPYAKEAGVMILLENMFNTYKDRKYESTCSNGWEAKKYVDALNEMAGFKCFGFCFDVGHSVLVGRDIERFMAEAGDCIEAFHIHDNDGVVDKHQAPYTGKADWDKFIAGLKTIHYNKTLSFETFMAVRTVPEELIPETLKYIAACGRYFAKKAEE